MRASYSKGRTTYDYEKLALDAHLTDTGEALNYRRMTYDYKALCDACGVDPAVYSGYIKSQSGPSVSIKFI